MDLEGSAFPMRGVVGVQCGKSRSGSRLPELRKDHCSGLSARGGAISADRLSGEAVSALIKRHVRRIGLEPVKFSGHSLRAGFVTSAARAGIATHLIRQQTGHASDATMGWYIREGSLFRGNAAGQLL